MTSDLRDRTDVEYLVDEFYRRVVADPLIGPIFTEIAKMDFAKHLPIMCDFWETVLFQTGGYRRNALQKHVDLNEVFTLEQQHFDRWLQLWNATVDEHFTGDRAQHAKIQASRIAGSIQRRLAGRSGSSYESLGRRKA